MSSTLDLNTLSSLTTVWGISSRLVHALRVPMGSVIAAGPVIELSIFSSMVAGGHFAFAEEALAPAAIRIAATEGGTANHAQHVLLIHFPIALFITGVAFDFVAQRTKRRGLMDAAYYNFLLAAASTVPVLVTGFLAWQFQLEGQKLKGILLLHLVSACASIVMMWMTWWVQFRGRRQGEELPNYRLAMEGMAAILIALTGHLGGFLSGVNGVG